MATSGGLTHWDYGDGSQGLMLLEVRRVANKCVLYIQHIFKRDQYWMSRKTKVATPMGSHNPLLSFQTTASSPVQNSSIEREAKSTCGHREQENTVVTDFTALRFASMSSELYCLTLIHPFQLSFGQC